MLIRYLLFAIIATVVNLLSQKACFELYHGPFQIYLAMMIGTGSGLVIKYILDKKFIFTEHTVDNLQQEASTFTFYTLMGGLTTLVFWGIELAFDYFLHYDWAKYLGGVIGLGIGYTIKFFLDRKFVFR
ncbi:GtrA family protein [Rapidithrix thailandica]|uniref:GtrA family protein n=1 Tax=Rapidithrix thailandica TaxID=413964 RepID=A0AAW9SDL7_9BACT